MSVVLTWQGSTPGQPQYGLATLTEHYKVQNDDGSQITAAAALLAGPALGAAHPTYSNMFVTDRYCAETGESASALDVTYMGILGMDLPTAKHDTENAVQSATSSLGTDGAIATSPITISFYAPTNVLTYWSTGGPGTDVADDPTDDLVVISIAIGDTAITGGSISSLVGIFFQQQLLETHNSTEIVAGQYWQNVSRKIKSYVAFVITLTPGVYISLSSPGSGFSVGNTLTITSGGETATMDIDTLGIGGSVASFTVTSNTFTIAHNFLAATGGAGSGAVFNVIVVT